MGEQHENQPGLPAYADWIETSGGEISFIRFEVEGLSELEEMKADEDLTDAQRQDPLISLPIFSLFAMFSVASFNMYGLDSLTQGDTYELGESSLADILVLQKTTVLAGDIHPGSLQETVLDSVAGAELERSDDIGNFAIYSAPDDAVDPIAIGDDGVVLPASDGPVTSVDEMDDPDQALLNTLETYVNGTNRAVDENEDFEWMVSKAGTGAIGIGRYGMDYGGDGPVDYQALSGMDGAVCSLNSDTNVFTSKFAGIVGDAEGDELRETLGASADEASVDIDDGRVIATATWEQ